MYILKMVSNVDQNTGTRAGSQPSSAGPRRTVSLPARKRKLYDNFGDLPKIRTSLDSIPARGRQSSDFIHTNQSQKLDFLTSLRTNIVNNYALIFVSEQ